jgi:hypothetical protein
MNRQLMPNLEILLKQNNGNGMSINSINYTSFGNCWVTYSGNFIIIENTTETTEKVEKRFTVYNLDDVKAFRTTDDILATNDGVTESLKYMMKILEDRKNDSQ